MILEHLIMHFKIISEALVEFKGKKNDKDLKICSFNAYF